MGELVWLDGHSEANWTHLVVMRVTRGCRARFIKEHGGCVRMTSNKGNGIKGRGKDATHLGSCRVAKQRTKGGKSEWNHGVVRNVVKLAQGLHL